MQKGLRGRILNMIADAFEAKQYWKDIYMQLPREDFPNALKLPSVHIAHTTEALIPLTSKQKDDEFAFEIILAMTAGKASRRLDLLKCEITDRAEETLMELQTDNAFRVIAALINVNSVDASPLSLAPLGIAKAILPPFGAVRLSCDVLFRYLAIE